MQGLSLKDSTKTELIPKGFNERAQLIPKGFNKRAGLIPKGFNNKNTANP